MRAGFNQIAAGFRGHVFECAVAAIEPQGITLAVRTPLDPLDVVDYVAVCREQILPPVVVVVRDRIAPSRVRQCGSCDPRLVGYILEMGGRVTEEEEALVCEICD